MGTDSELIWGSGGVSSPGRLPTDPGVGFLPEKPVKAFRHQQYPVTWGQNPPFLPSSLHATIYPSTNHLLDH